MVRKIRPNAEPYYNTGNDGRDSYWDIRYTCPQCGRTLQQYLMGCDQCGMFFDWSKKPRIKVIREVVWE